MLSNPTTAIAPPQTLLQKLWNRRVVKNLSEDEDLLYIDRHLIYEVTSPQAFEGLRSSGRRVWRPDSVLATVDHNVPTMRHERKSVSDIPDRMAQEQVRTLIENVQEHGIKFHGLGDSRQGIVHVIGPELGWTLPGTTIVAGDSHTSTHGAFGTLAFGVGTSDVEHVLATQCLVVKQMRTLRVMINGRLPEHVVAKDLALFVIKAIGSAGGVGHAIEFAGEAVAALSMEGRMTLCNMAIEAGARVGLVGVDETTLEYVKQRAGDKVLNHWLEASADWKTLHSDSGAQFDREVVIEAKDVPPMVTWGTSPDMAVPANGTIPKPEDLPDEQQRRALEQSLAYMGLEPGTRLVDVAVDKVFIGSCTNSRIEDLRLAARQIQGRSVSKSLKQAIVVPGSGLVKQQAEREGLHLMFMEAGFEWREPGCSMCLGMNNDRLNPGERCASTSNRNFEGRQGAGGRSHLVSPSMAVAAAIHGRFVDVREDYPNDAV